MTRNGHDWTAELEPTDDAIIASAGDWFAAMRENEKASVIATMRNLAPN